jgi:CRISPR-associated protein Csx3
MVNLLPAVLIGGPPHAGKSVLFYSLTHALRKRGVRHHAIRACPDGEGDWFQELDPDQRTVSLIHSSGPWSPEFVTRICRDLERRYLPLLVDMGGRPREEQYTILRQCTHSLLLLRADREEDDRNWRRYVQINGLLPLAVVYSELNGSSVLKATRPVIEGTITELERYRGHMAQGPVFDALVDRLAALFTSYSDADREKVLLDQAPTELVVNLYLSLQAIDSATSRWDYTMLPALLADLPADTPLSVYGAGPHWLYAALSVYAGEQPFYQFDPRLGWVEPLAVQSGDPTFPDLNVQVRGDEEKTILSVNIVPKHLEYFQQEPLPFPPVPTGRGLILDGSMPSWLVTGLTRFYHRQSVAWIACHQPQLKGAIVVASRVSAYAPGDFIPFKGTSSIVTQQ